MGATLVAKDSTSAERSRTSWFLNWAIRVELIWVVFVRCRRVRESRTTWL